MPFDVPGDLTRGVDIEEVKRALEVLVTHGRTFELRTLPTGRSWVGRDVSAASEAVPGLANGSGMYYMMNPVRPDLKGAAGNKDILERYWFLVDVDSYRPDKNDPATDDEKREAANLAKLVRLDLKSHGCPDPVVIDSGNGYQLLYRVELPNDDLAQKWVSLALKRLAELYDTKTANVDVSVHNAGRLARLPGTWNRKGTPTPDRPHRLARLEVVPDHLDVIPTEVMREIAGLKPGAKPDARPVVAEWTVPVANGKDSAWYRKALANEAGRVAIAPQGERHNTLRAAARTLAGYVHLGHMTEAEIVAALTVAGERAGLDAKDVHDAIAWGVENGKANPLPVPGRLAGVMPVFGAVGGGEATETTGQSGRGYKFPLVVRGSDVERKRIDWLWEDRIPYGFLTLFAGRTKVGKSFVTLDIASRVTVGGEVPLDDGGLCFEPACCLIISEDPHEYVLVPRMLDAGADMEKVSFMTWEAMASFTLEDIAMLNDTYLAAGSPKLIVIDPPTNFLGGKDEHKNAEVRGVLMGVSIWAMMNHAAVILITHCNKGNKKDMAAIDRIIGSIAWASTTRIAHIFGPHPDEDGQNVFVPLGTNIGRPVGGMTYQIVEEDACVRVRWVGAADLSADEMMTGEKKKPRGVVATEWLMERFREQREWPSLELFREAAESGISRNALFSPEVNALPIKKHKHVNAEGKVHWSWKAGDGWPPEDVKTAEIVGTLGIVGRNPMADKTHGTIPISKGSRTINVKRSQESQESHSLSGVCGGAERERFQVATWLRGFTRGNPLPENVVFETAMESKGYTKQQMIDAALLIGVEVKETDKGVIWEYLGE